MARNWTVGRKLFTGTGALTALIVILGIMAWRSAASIQGRLTETGANTVRRLSLSIEAQADIERLFAAVGGMVLASMAHDAPEVTAQRNIVADATKETNDELAELVPLLRTDSGKQAAAGVQQQMAKLADLRREFEADLAAGKEAEAYKLFRQQGIPLHDASIEAIRVIVSNQQKFLTEDMSAASDAYDQVRIAIISTFGLAVVVALVVGTTVRGVVRVLREVTMDLASGAEQVSGASGQVAASAQSLSQGASEQAAALEESSASMEEMASMTRTNAESSQQAATLMQDVDRQVGQSHAALTGMVASMAGIRESSAKISKIIKTINEIAFQTNILALNAAVEAARAGEAGMGFAVVADEVRNLAHGAARASQETATLIEEANARAQQGSTQVEQVASAITAITGSVASVKTLVEQVSAASRQQTQGIDQVTQAMGQMETVTQSTAATAEETAAASEELSAQAVISLEAVALLQRLVNGEESAESVNTANGANTAAGPRGPHKPTLRYNRSTTARAA